MLRLLGPGDEPALDAFLVRHADFSMFLRSNSRAAGLVYEGQPLQAEYVAAFDGGDIVAVAAHCWNNMLLVQAPVDVAAVARAAVEQSRRPVAGLSGPADQVLAARSALGLDDRPAPKFGREELFALDLKDLVVPAPLGDGRWTCRRPRSDELEFLVDWRVDFAREALQFPDSPTLRNECEHELHLVHERGSNWVLEDGGLVSYSASMPGCRTSCRSGACGRPWSCGDGDMAVRSSPDRFWKCESSECDGRCCLRSGKTQSARTGELDSESSGSTDSCCLAGVSRRAVEAGAEPPGRRVDAEEARC